MINRLGFLDFMHIADIRLNYLMGHLLGYTILQNFVDWVLL